MSIFDYLQPEEEQPVQQDEIIRPKPSKIIKVAAVGRCENKDNCPDYPYSCKGECFWCHRNKNLELDNCLNCRLYKIECFPEHPTAHGSCPKYKQVPEFYHVHRCQTCKFWSCNAEQPPAGWGIYGFCSRHKEKTSSTSDCCENDFEGES